MTSLVLSSRTGLMFDVPTSSDWSSPVEQPTAIRQRHVSLGNIQGWKFALWFFVRIAHFWPKKRNCSFRSFYKERATRANRSLCSFCKELQEWNTLVPFLKEQFTLYFYKSKAKKFNINLKSQFSVSPLLKRANLS